MFANEPHRRVGANWPALRVGLRCGYGVGAAERRRRRALHRRPCCVRWRQRRVFARRHRASARRVRVQWWGWRRERFVCASRTKLPASLCTDARRVLGTAARDAVGGSRRAASRATWKITCVRGRQLPAAARRRRRRRRRRAHRHWRESSCRSRRHVRPDRCCPARTCGPRSRWATACATATRSTPRYDSSDRPHGALSRRRGRCRGV